MTLDRNSMFHCPAEGHIGKVVGAAPSYFWSSENALPIYSVVVHTLSCMHACTSCCPLPSNQVFIGKLLATLEVWVTVG